MGVTSEVTGVECDEREYPWLGELSGTVVLFSGHGVGTVVADVDDEGSDWEIGEHFGDWDMDMFDPFEGEVKLTNNNIELVVLEE